MVDGRCAAGRVKGIGLAGSINSATQDMCPSQADCSGGGRQEDERTQVTKPRFKRFLSISFNYLPPTFSITRLISGYLKLGLVAKRGNKHSFELANKLWWNTFSSKNEPKAMFGEIIGFEPTTSN